MAEPDLPPIPFKTEAELRQLALDMLEGKVYTHGHIPEDAGIGIGQIWITLSLGGLPYDAKPEDIGLIYEYLDKAAPRSMNGCPQFWSTQFLNPQDKDTMVEYMNKAEALFQNEDDRREAFLAGELG